MKQRKFNQGILEIFQKFNGKSFTVGQALEAYMAIPSKIHSDQKTARQYVHRHMLRLVESGDLQKVDGEGRRHKYLFSDQFNINRVNSKIASPATKEVPTAQGVSIQKILTERLHHQKLMLLTAMGEAEEYDAIYKAMPEMREKIQELYNESRDRCSKLLGKVKAIENLITLNSR